MASPGTTNLISWWALDETSGTRVDAHGSNDLTDNNTVGSTTGKQSNAADFTRTNDEYLSHADNASLSTGDIDFTVGMWVNFDNFSAAMSMMNMRGPTTANADLDYEVLYLRTLDGGNDSPSFYIGSGSSNAGVDSSASFSTGTWYFVLAWRDKTAETINIQVDDGSVDSTSTSLAPNDAADSFQLGSLWTGANILLDGLLDEAFFYKRVLTSDERTWLYNSGSGRAYSDLSGDEAGGGTVFPDALMMMGCG